MVSIFCVFMLMQLLPVAHFWTLQRAKGATPEADKDEVIIIVATMGSTFKLPGHLTFRSEGIFKDGRWVSVDEQVYEVAPTALGFQVTIRFVTCTDEGIYTIGSERFMLCVKARDCGMFYYTARVNSDTKAALISPLDGVVQISKFHVDSSSDEWSLDEVWNDKMNKTTRPAHCCFIVQNGTTFSGYGDTEYKYFLYSRHGHVNQSCSDVHTSSKNKHLTIPNLQPVEDVKTHVDLVDIQDITDKIQDIINDFNTKWNSAASLNSDVQLMLIIALTLVIFL